MILTVQTRDADGHLCYHTSIEEALVYSAQHLDVWKMSYRVVEPDGKETRYRFVRSDVDPHVWFNEPINAKFLDRIAQDLAAQRKRLPNFLDRV